MHEVLFEQFVSSFASAPRELILDFDCTDESGSRDARGAPLSRLLRRLLLFAAVRLFVVSGNWSVICGRATSIQPSMLVQSFNTRRIRLCLSSSFPLQELFLFLPGTLLRLASCGADPATRKTMVVCPAVSPDAALAASVSPLFLPKRRPSPKTVSLPCPNHHMVQKAG
jgi:hypothetical protein